MNGTSWYSEWPGVCNLRRFILLHNQIYVMKKEKNKLRKIAFQIEDESHSEAKNRRKKKRENECKEKWQKNTQQKINDP